MDLAQPVQGTCFRILLPVENPDSRPAAGPAGTDDAGEPETAEEPQTVAGPETAGRPGMTAGTAAAPARGAS
jgi:hypothetical protein